MQTKENSINGTSALRREIIVIDPTVQEKSALKQRVAAYARVSSDSDDQLNSFAAQIGHYTDLFSSHKEWEMVDIYTDESITGTRADTRPDFQRMLRDCRKGKINRILTKSLSRFSRNTKDCLETLRELSTLGITVFFEKENIDTADMPSELIVTLFSSGAQEESYSISGNMRWACKRRMQNGTYVPSPPYGYVIENKKLTIEPIQAEIVRRIFADYLCGKGMLVIAKELNAQGVPCKHSSAQWRKDSVAYILKSERYIGDSLFQKSYTTTTLPFTKVLNRGEKDRYYIKNSHPAIISREDYDSVQQLLTTRKAKHSSDNRQQYSLAGKIKCGNCESLFKRKECKGDAYWSCYKHYYDKDDCPITQIPEREFYNAFVVLYNKLKCNYSQILTPMLEQLQTMRANRNQSNLQIVEINKEMANLTEQNHVLSGLKSKGYIDSALFISQTGELSRKIAQLRADKNKLMDSGDEDSMIVNTQNLIELLENAPDYLDEFEPQIFEGMVAKIIVASNSEIRFCLTNSLELAETIERTVRS